MKKNFFYIIYFNHSVFDTLLVLITLVLIVGCSLEKEEDSLNSMLNRTIAEADLREHISVLASDEFGGRMPFTKGEKKTIEYLENAFNTFGLEPGNGNSYFQAVPLVEIAICRIKTVDR